MFPKPLRKVFPWQRKQGPFDFMRGYYISLDRWAGETRWMSATEEGIYVRLLNWALKNESPLPLEVAECYRIAVASSGSEKAAVRTVLAHAFKRTEFGHESEDLTRTLAEWQGKQPILKAKRENTKARVERWRNKQQEAAKAMHESGRAYRPAGGFETIEQQLATTRGIVDTDVDNRGESEDPVTRYETGYDGVNGRVTDAFSNGLGQGLGLEQEKKLSSESSAREGGGTEAGRACREMRRVGLVGVNPSHPQLLALLAAGATLDHFAALAASAVARGKGFGWVLAAVQGQLTEGERSARALADRKHDEAGSVMAQLAPSLVKSR